jgi:hypothetical protein
MDCKNHNVQNNNNTLQKSTVRTRSGVIRFPSVLLIPCVSILGCSNAECIGRLMAALVVRILAGCVCCVAPIRHCRLSGGSRVVQCAAFFGIPKKEARVVPRLQYIVK